MHTCFYATSEREARRRALLHPRPVVMIPLSLLALFLGGCVIQREQVGDRALHRPAPIIGDGYIALGFFLLDRARPCPQVRYRRIRGLGLLLTDGRASLGYANHGQIIAQLEGSYHIDTPIGQIAVGKKAEDLGASILDIDFAPESPAPHSIPFFHNPHPQSQP